MATRPSLDPHPSFLAWLEREGDVRPPDALLEQVLVRTTKTHRRPGWLVIERWFPMQLTARFGAVPRAAVILVLLGALLAVAGAIGLGSAPSPEPLGPGMFSPTSPLTVGRVSHTTTLLPDGRILVAGGYEADSSAEVRSATDGTFEPTLGTTLKVPRHHHTATLLDNGRVLLVGGKDAQSAEVWDPNTEGFTSLGPLVEYRSNHTATLLSDGRVLIVGGYDGPAAAELFDPDTGRFSPAGSLAHVRGHHRAALLSDGRVLIVGGPAEAELWDPETMAFSPAGSLAQSRWWGTATALPDDRVLVIGGFAGEAFGEGDGPVPTAELWDPRKHSFTPAGSLLEARGHHTATLLDDGRILVVGGGDGPDAPTRSAELWDPATLTFSAADSLADARGGHTATLLPDHRVLVIGGYGAGDIPLASTEIWDPVPDATGLRWTLESTGRDWPAPVRQEPPGGAAVVAGERRLTGETEDERGVIERFYDHEYADPHGDVSGLASESVDITSVTVGNHPSGVSFHIAVPAPRLPDPGERWIAFGLVVDSDGDGGPDVRIGMDNAPGDVHREWVTDLAAGTTVAQVGPPYGHVGPLPGGMWLDTWYPGEEGAEDRGILRVGRLPTEARLYAWASVIEDGQILGTDYAPDEGWIAVTPKGDDAPGQ